MTCFANAVTSGSSPHMRGTLRVGIPVRYEARIIPAYAGNTPIRTRTSTVVRDHPRICGEHRGHCQGGFHGWGSSPHMRGTRPKAFPLSEWTRIIPAYAGNTCNSRCVMEPIWDHPRICGEHLVHALVEFLGTGSSPHMRGTQILVQPDQPSTGIIPAYAGNTTSCPRYPCRCRDHPRICGEHPPVRFDEGS